MVCPQVTARLITCDVDYLKNAEGRRRQRSQQTVTHTHLAVEKPTTPINKPYELDSWYVCGCWPDATHQIPIHLWAKLVGSYFSGGGAQEPDGWDEPNMRIGGLTKPIASYRARFGVQGAQSFAIPTSLKVNFPNN